MSRTILKREYFGGVCIDTATGSTTYLSPSAYALRRAELLAAKGNASQDCILDVTERGYPLLENAASSPYYVFWELTRRCNGSCAHCFMDANSPGCNAGELGLPDIANIVQKLADLGVHSIRLSGGEPTVRHDFFDIVALMAEHDMAIGLNTNGFWTDHVRTQLLSAPIKDIRISIDGPEEINDRIRGTGSYARAVDSVRSVAEYNKNARVPVRLTINTVLMKANHTCIEAMIHLAHTHAARISFGLLRPTGRASLSEMLSPQEVLDSAFRVHSTRLALRLPSFAARINFDVFCDETRDMKGMSLRQDAPFPFDNARCVLGGTGFHIGAHARISPCGYLADARDLVAEDIRNGDLLQLWHESPLLKRIRRVRIDSCTSCSLHENRCRSACPAMSYYAGGSLGGPDPYCVRTAYETLAARDG